MRIHLALSGQTSSTVAAVQKKIGRLIRSKLVPMAKHFVLGTQYGGGFNGGETAFAHLQLRLITDCAHLVNLSSSVICVEVVAAFGSMLRSIVFDSKGGDEAWCKQVSTAGFSDLDIASIMEHVSISPGSKT